MNLQRVRLRPRSPWRTPWQADTLTGALCATCARVYPHLLDRLISPIRTGHPPFVLSDAFPGDLLPIPVVLRLAKWPDNIDPKVMKRARWLLPDDFATSCTGQLPSADRLLPDNAVLLTETTRHNTLARDSDASLEEGGLFARSDVLLHPNLVGTDYLSLYFRVTDNASADLFLDLLHELSLTGFGADVATGRGQFDIVGDPEPMSDLDKASANADAVVCLSTFQPGPADPTDGLWEAFAKFGKVGPDLGLSEVRKRTLILFRPGACFRVTPQRPFLGHAIPGDKLLSKESATALSARGINIIHPAFGLAIPARLPWGDKVE